MRLPRRRTRLPGELIGIIALVVLALAAAPGAEAHRLRPAIVTIAVAADGTWTATLVLNLEAVLAGIGPEHADTNAAPQAAVYDELRAQSPDRLRSGFDAAAARYLADIELRFDGRPVRTQVAALDIPPVGDLGVERLSTLRLTGLVPPGSRTVAWRYGERRGDSAVRFLGIDGKVVRADWLRPGVASEPYPLDPAQVPRLALADIVRTYVGLGYTHILPRGLDHVLFIVALCLLPLGVPALVWQVTAFTIAHSVTLALGLYGVVDLPASLVEPLIALSIAWVAVENLWLKSLARWRLAIVFGFGLLHGLGFAGVLRELGLPAGDYVPALLAFNAGVELGQLTVVLAVLVLAGPWVRRQPWYRPRVLVPASLAIAAVGLFWTVQRVTGLA